MELIHKTPEGTLTISISADEFGILVSGYVYATEDHGGPSALYDDPLVKSCDGILAAIGREPHAPKR